MGFWEVHGVLFLLCLFFFPRLTMLFSGICFAWSGFLFWLGWIFAPRLTVAVLATTVYWGTNPVLCVLAWFWAFAGEFAEKKGSVHVVNWYRT